MSVFNKNTEEITICTINIKTGEIVSTKKTDALKSQGFKNSSCDLLYSNNCIFVSQYSGASKILNIDTGKIVDGKGFKVYGRCSYTINDKESFVFNNDRNTTFIFNSERMDLRNINYVYHSSSSSSTRYFYSGENGDMYNYSKGFSRNPFYLGTINNLGTPVTKTADKTMKITHTLTEA